MGRWISGCLSLTVFFSDALPGHAHTCELNEGPVEGLHLGQDHAV